jgi:hypothetical protein
MSSPQPPTVSPNQILGVIGNAVKVQTPPSAPPTVTPTQVQGAVGGGGINVGVFTERERALAAINLSYFVGAIMTLVILLVFIDYLAHVPATPGSAANNQPAQQASPTPTAPTPQPTPAGQRTAEARQTVYMQEAALLDAPAGQASPSPRRRPRRRLVRRHKWSRRRPRRTTSSASVTPSRSVLRKCSTS